MSNLYSILKEPNDAKLNDYLNKVARQVDIDNCKTMVNTFVPGVRFTTETLIQHCKDNGIKYFTRGEYDVFTLEEIELIYSILNNGTYKEAFEGYKNEYPKRNTDMTLDMFKEKLDRIKENKEREEEMKRKELKSTMRCTNEVVEYVRDMAKEHTIEECLELIQKSRPELEMDMEKLEDMKERYLIRFVTEDLKFFNKKELEAIIRLGQTCGSLRETYNIFVGMFPNKCTFVKFVTEISKLRTLSMFNTREGVGKFTPLEDLYIEDLATTDRDAVSLYSDFNLVFPNRCPFVQFSTRLNEIRVAKLPKTEKVHKGREADPMNEPLEEFIRTFNGEKTIKELIELIDNDGRFKRFTYNNLYNFLYIRKMPYKAEEKKGKAKSIVTKSDWELVKKYADMGYTVKEIKEQVDKEIEAFKDISFKGFQNRLNRNGIKTHGYKGRKPKSNAEAKIRVKGKSSILDTIYNDVIVTVEGNTITKALEELKQKHPDIADQLTYSKLIMYSKRRNLNFIKDSKGMKGKTEKAEKNEVEVVKSKPTGRRGIADEVYEDLKELCKDFTQAECLEIINKRYGVNYTSTYISTLVGRKGKLKFKVYEEFTDEMKDILKGLMNLIHNKHDLYSEFSKTFKGAFRPQQFFSLLDIFETENSKIVVHNTGDPSKPQIMVVPVGVRKENNKIEPEVKVEWHQEELPIEELEDDVQQVEFVESTQQNVVVENPYQPIIDEVNAVFERKCHQLGVEGDTHVHTDELIGALEIIIKYAQGKKELVDLTNDHEDILEQYRREVEHEIEIQPWSETDTYCQNKLKAIAMRRREVKYTRDDLNVMNLLLANVKENITTYTKTLEAMKYRKYQRENSVFIPLVDTGMAKKYDWCRNATLSDKRAYTPVLKTNARIARINNHKAQGSQNIWTETEDATKIQNTDQVGKPARNTHRVSTYRVKAEFMVLKGNPFVNKYYDIKATNEDLAKEKAKEYFDLISANNDNAQYVITDVTRLNR